MLPWKLRLIKLSRTDTKVSLQVNANWKPRLNPACRRLQQFSCDEIIHSQEVLSLDTVQALKLTFLTVVCVDPLPLPASFGGLHEIVSFCPPHGLYFVRVPAVVGKRCSISKCDHLAFRQQSHRVAEERIKPHSCERKRWVWSGVAGDQSGRVNLC